MVLQKQIVAAVSPRSLPAEIHTTVRQLSFQGESIYASQSTRGSPYIKTK